MDVQNFFSFDYPPVPEDLTCERRKQLAIDQDKHQKVEELRHLLKQKPNLRFPEDESFLLQFLRVRKFDVKRAAQLCKNFLRKLHDCKFLYQDIDLPSLKRKFIENKCFGILPSRDREDCVVVAIFAGLWDPQKITTEEFEQATMATVIQCVRSPLTQVAGFKFIIDFSGYSIRHITSVSPISVWHGVDSVQNCLPCPIKGVYVVNENIIFHRLWSFLRLILKKKIVDRFHFIGSNMEELYKSFPAETLPEYFGGTAGSFRVEPWLELMNEFDDYFTFVKQFGFNPV